MNDVWIHEIARDVQTPLTFGEGSVISEPQWTPDGRALVYAEAGSGDSNTRLYLHPVDGTGERELLLTHSVYLYPSSLTPDGQNLILAGATPGSRWDIYSLPMDGAGELEPLVQTPFNERDPRLAPDGRFLAYVSDKSGRSEVYLRPFPGPGREIQASTRGGSMPRWSPSGSELYYREGDTVMVIAFDAAEAEVGLPEKLFDLEDGAADLAVGPDGRFLMRRVLPEASDSRIWVITNLAEELR